MWLKNPTLRSSREAGVPRAVNTRTCTPPLSGLDREVVGATGGITPEGATGISGGSTSGGNVSLEAGSFRGSGSGDFVTDSTAVGGGAGVGTALGTTVIGFASDEGGFVSRSPGTGGNTIGGTVGTVGVGVVPRLGVAGPLNGVIVGGTVLPPAG